MPDRILIADDDRVSTTMLDRTLRRWDFDPIVVHDGTAAWEIFSGPAPPPLAILDWMMPGIDGVELCRRVRAAELKWPIYLILLTGRDSREDLIAGLDAGADDYLTKPFDPSELRARIGVGQRTLALMARVNQLSGLLPICSYCKRIRSDHDYWEQVDTYLVEHSDVVLSHGVCPPCMEHALETIYPARRAADPVPKKKWWWR
jgi:DNA-binding response OmpR family regulator